jgi:hypothetical protein
MFSDRKFAEESKLLRKTLNYGSIISKICQKVDIFLNFLIRPLRRTFHAKRRTGGLDLKRRTSPPKGGQVLPKEDLW